MVIPLLIGSFVAVLTSAGPPAPSPACSLLTAADIEGATGVKPEGPHPGEQTVPGSAQRVALCTWVVRASQGQVVVSVSPLPPGGNATALAKNNVGMDALRAQHYREESQDYGTAWCAVMTPPPTVKEGLKMSSCTAGPKETILSVVFTSPTKTLSIEKTKFLLDKAAARVP